MYVWNGFPLVSKRKDLSENLLVTVEKAEAALQSESKYEKREPGNLYGCPLPSFPRAHLLMLICVRDEDKDLEPQVSG